MLLDSEIFRGLCSLEVPLKTVNFWPICKTANFHSFEKLQWGVDMPKLGQIHIRFQNSSRVTSQEI